MTTHKCIWGCGHVYTDFNQQIEGEHLAVCDVYQTLPVSQYHDDKEFVELPSCPGLMVERTRIN